MINTVDGEYFDKDGYLQIKNSQVIEDTGETLVITAEIYPEDRMDLAMKQLYMDHNKKDLTVNDKHLSDYPEVCEELNIHFKKLTGDTEDDRVSAVKMRKK